MPGARASIHAAPRNVTLFTHVLSLCVWAVSLSGSDSGGDEVSHEEVHALKEQVAQLQAAVEEAEKRAAAELSSMQWRLRTSVRAAAGTPCPCARVSPMAGAACRR